MKFFLMLFFLCFLSHAQVRNYSMIKREILSDIIRQEAFNNGKNFIVSKIDSLNVEHLLKLILEKPYITNFHNPDENFILTTEELQYLSKRIREQYQHQWKEEDFNNRKLIKQSDILECLDKDISNQILMVSDPIFIKNDDTAFIYFANLCCCSAYGNSTLALYTKKGGLWKKSFEIIKDNY